jgi:hypothetical protein
VTPTRWDNFASSLRLPVTGLRDEVIEFYPSRAAAERELAEILVDEPGWVAKLKLVLVDFSSPEQFVRPAGSGDIARKAVEKSEHRRVRA